MNKMNEEIYYLLKNKEPLSAEVFIIKEKNNVYIYDVGNGEKYINIINKFQENKHVILSHFHPDHIYNLLHINYDILYQSKNTSKYTKVNHFISQEINMGEISIFEIPSTHAKGCLALKYKDYLFVGDALYPNNKGLYNVNALKMQIDYLQNTKINYVIMSHHDPLIQTKEEVLQHLKKIYDYRNPKEAFSNVNI